MAKMNEGTHQTVRANNLILKAGCKILIDSQSKLKLNNNGSMVIMGQRIQEDRGQ